MSPGGCRRARARGGGGAGARPPAALLPGSHCRGPEAGSGGRHLRHAQAHHGGEHYNVLVHYVDTLLSLSVHSAQRTRAPERLPRAVEHQEVHDGSGALE